MKLPRPEDINNPPLGLYRVEPGFGKGTVLCGGCWGPILNNTVRYEVSDMVLVFMEPGKEKVGRFHIGWYYVCPTCFPHYCQVCKERYGVNAVQVGEMVNPEDMTGGTGGAHE